MFGLVDLQASNFFEWVAKTLAATSLNCTVQEKLFYMRGLHFSVKTFKSKSVNQSPNNHAFYIQTHEF